MTTRILDLAQLGGTLQAVTNADWFYSFRFVVSKDDQTPIPLNGIEFEGQMRASEEDGDCPLILSTLSGTFVKDDAIGALTILVPMDADPGGYCMRRVPLRSEPYKLDIIAKADGRIINLCQDGGPIDVTIRRGVTRDD